jgi:hypothetical protein
MLTLSDAVDDFSKQVSAFIFGVGMSSVTRRGGKPPCFLDFNTGEEDIMWINWRL